jgi:hypothetical protein
MPSSDVPNSTFRCIVYFPQSHPLSPVLDVCMCSISLFPVPASDLNCSAYQMAEFPFALKDGACLQDR